MGNSMRKSQDPNRSRNQFEEFFSGCTNVMISHLPHFTTVFNHITIFYSFAPVLRRSPHTEITTGRNECKLNFLTSHRKFFNHSPFSFNLV